MQQVKNILLFTAMLILFCGVYYLMMPRQIALPHSSWRHGVGEAVGGGVLWLFAAIYGRTLLKLLLRRGTLLNRLLPEGLWNDIALPWARKLLTFLNRTHPYVGVAVVILAFSHAALEGVQQANLLMRIILALAVWQFAFGLFLLQRYQLVFLKKSRRYGYLAHSQLYTGITIGVCALFGHLLVSG